MKIPRCMKSNIAANKRRILRVNQEIATLQLGNCKFCGSSHLWGSCPAFGKTCGYCQRKDHFARVCRKKLENLGGKTVRAMAEEPDDSDTGADLFTFSVE